MATKRVATSSVNWAKLSERLVPEHAAELARVKGQNSTFAAAVSQLPADLPKVDFAALKKQLPSHAAVLDSLQKQYEAIKIPYGEVPRDYLKEVDQWAEFNKERIALHELKVADGLEQAKKVGARDERNPDPREGTHGSLAILDLGRVEVGCSSPVEHFDRQHFSEYFPQHFYDLRFQPRLPDPCNIGINESPEIEQRFKDYKVLRRADKVDDH